jgi:hypothetical protein
MLCKAVIFSQSSGNRQSTENQITIESRSDPLPAELSEAVSPALRQSSVSLRSKQDGSEQFRPAILSYWGYLDIGDEYFFPLLSQPIWTFFLLT